VTKRSSHRNYLFIAGFILLLGVSYSCNTKKDTLTRRLYHNITSRYNVYFNGKESLNEGTIELVEGVKDNYTEVLPVFNFGTKQEAQQLNPSMDRAIQKASICIQKHSMPFDGTEKVRWIDDSYLLIGKAYFYKQEYFSARRTFNFIVQEYGYNEIKYEAMLWLALTYNQTKEFEKSEPLLNLIATDISNGKVPESAIEKLPQLYADLYIRQGYYDKAVEYLFEAIAYSPKRDLKTRMMFILAQIFQRNDDLIRATEWYETVIRRNPPYEMAFQAKINLARSFDANSGDRKQINKILTRMLKDEKNKDYKDQIYFALSDVALRDRDTIAGIDYLRLSVSSSMTNNYQKATSSLKLADLYFKIPAYEEAQAYYDTAMMFIPKDYPDYNQIQLRTAVLTTLVENLITIQVQDSLQRVANMSEDDRNALISNLIRLYQEEQARLMEQKRIEAELARQEQINSFTGQGTTQAQPVGGKWYFYNSQTKEYGYSEFLKKWGKRKYEDLWRISNKQSVSFAEDETLMEADTTLADSVVAAQNDPLKRDYYLKDLPVTEEDFAASDKKILDAYFSMGKVYRDGLRDYPESNSSLITMNSRYPASEHELQSFYYIYRNYTDLGDAAAALQYKNQIISIYPESDYAKILEDPEYMNKLIKEKNKVAELYEDTYRSYEAGQYYQVIAKSDLALSLYGDTNDLAPRFEYLRAVSIGKVDVVDSLVSNLKRIILKYPNSEIKTLSQSVLAHIMQENPELKDEAFVLPGEVPAEKPSPYKANPSMQHMFMIVVDSREIRLNPFKVKLSDYNIKYFSLESLNINSLVLDNEHYLITVGNFNNKQKALDYLEAISISDYIYADLKPGSYFNFVISTENYPVFFKEKNIEEYQKFFDKYYK
jgi:tetratricopeptide (TPR) repeat protein